MAIIRHYLNPFEIVRDIQLCQGDLAGMIIWKLRKTVNNTVSDILRKTHFFILGAYKQVQFSDCVTSSGLEHFYIAAFWIVK